MWEGWGWVQVGDSRWFFLWKMREKGKEVGRVQTTLELLPDDIYQHVYQHFVGSGSETRISCQF